MLISLIEPIQGKLGADKISFHSSSTRDPCLSKSPIFEWSNQKECWRKSPDYAEHFERLEWGGLVEMRRAFWIIRLSWTPLTPLISLARTQPHCL